jgi:hypothetical protein
MTDDLFDVVFFVLQPHLSDDPVPVGSCLPPWRRTSNDDLHGRILHFFPHP